MTTRNNGFRRIIAGLTDDFYIELLGDILFELDVKMLAIDLAFAFF